MPREPGSKMTQEHKDALAAGRANAKSVRTYLEALEQNKPRRGRKRTPESVQKQLDGIDAKLAQADPVQRLNLIQQRLDLLEEQRRLTAQVDLSGLEREFVKVAKDYSESKGISAAAWREVGVPASVLRAAGITRSGK